MNRWERLNQIKKDERILADLLRKYSEELSADESETIRTQYYRTYFRLQDNYDILGSRGLTDYSVVALKRFPIYLAPREA